MPNCQKDGRFMKKRHSDKDWDIYKCSCGKILMVDKTDCPWLRHAVRDLVLFGYTAITSGDILEKDNYPWDALKEIIRA